MAEGFLGRWSQRKQALRLGQPLVEPIPTVEPPVVATKAADASKIALDKTSAPALSRAVAAGTAAPATVAPAKVPTLEDVRSLTANDSFARFVAPGVPSSVRNAALKKLFCDPRYNVMDGLDTYIDDYSVASPLPAATLRRLASAEFLHLSDENPTAAIGEDADTAPAAVVAQSAPAPDLPEAQTVLPTETVSKAAQPDPTQELPHDYLDLRLQPNDAAGCTLPGREPEPNPDAAFESVPPPNH